MATNQYRVQDQAFVVTLIINSVISVIGLLLFCFLRKKYLSFYHYRYTSSQKGVDSIPPDGIFSWITDTIRFDNKKVIQVSGLDGYMYLKNVKTLFFICLTLMLISVIMLYPTNYHGKYNDYREEGADEVVGLALISMSNIERGSNLLWVHVVFGFIVTGVILFYLYRDYQEYSQRRIVFKQQNRVMNYSVYIKDIPHQLFSKDAIIEYFNNFFPFELREFVLFYPSDPIYKLVRERENFVRRYEGAVFKYRKTNQRPEIKSFICCGSSKDAITYYTEQIDEKTRQIDEMRQALDRNHEKTNKGGNGVFVFKQRQTAKALTQTIVNRDYPFTFSRYQAPDPNDINFANATNIGMKSFLIRTLIVGIFIFALVFFWSIPVAFLSGFSNLGTLAKISAFSWLVDVIELSPVLAGFLQGFLPNLVLIVFMALLIPIITAVSRAQGFISQSSIEGSVLRKYFFFLVFNVFLISAIAGSIFQSIETIVNNPASIITMLANSLPGVAFQMINYVMIAAVASTMGILRIVGLIIRQLKLKFLSKTKRQIKETLSCGSFNYGVSHATNLLIFQIVLAYSTLSPFILIFGVWYFGGTFLVTKFNIIWVNTPNYQYGGQYYPMAFRRTIVSLLIYQILMIGSFNIYKFFFGNLLIIPLVFTLIYWGYCEFRFSRLAQYGILDVHINQNQEDEEIFMKGEFYDSTISSSQYIDQYKQPYDRELMNPTEDIEIQPGPGFPNV